MAAFLDNCRFVPTAGGTGDWAYSVAVAGSLSPTAANAVNGRNYKFIAISADLSQFEITEGAYNSSTGTFARTTVLYNSSATGTMTPGQSGAGTKINFSTIPQVAIIAVKEDLLSVEEANAFTTLQKAQARANLDVTKKNYIVNGGMQVSQENGANAGTASGYFPVDQFLYTLSGSSGACSVAQVASPTPGGSPNRLRVTVTTADTSVGSTDVVTIGQPIEGRRVADLKLGTANAKTVTVQFGVRAPAGTYCVSVRNAATARSYVAEYTVAAGEANTDVVKSVTIALDQIGTWATDNAVGLYVYWGLMMGSTYQTAAGSWAAGNFMGSANQFNLMGTSGNIFELFDVGLYEGGAAPSFALPDFFDALQLCQRYFEKSYDYATAIGSAGVYLGSRAILQNQASTPTSVSEGVFTVRKRAAPTVTIYSPNDGSTGNGYDTANRSCSASQIGESMFLVVGVLGIASTPIYYHFTANARM